MQRVLTPSEMAEADRRTIDAGTPFGALVERAGRALAREVLAVLSGAYGKRAVIICGPGNNGADGVVAARVLRSRGVRCGVFALTSPLDRSAVAREIECCDVLVDAMFGTGFHGALDGDAAWIAEQTNQRSDGLHTFRVVAVDIPSGVQGLTGATLGSAVSADRTVTFGALKPGLLFEPGRGLCGSITVAEIGIEISEGTLLGLVDEQSVREWIPQRMANDHKWALGPVMVIGGSLGMAGAPRLSAASALRAGSGVVVVYSPDPSGAESPADSPRQGTRQSTESPAESARQGRGSSAESLAESPLRGGAHSAESAETPAESIEPPVSWGSEVITRVIPLGQEGHLNSDSSEYLIEAARRFDAVLIGPGLGADHGVAEMVRALICAVTAPIVLDADGLNALGGDLSPLRERAELGLGPLILTPHEGEFERLSGEVGSDRVAAARGLARDAAATVLLKGPTTVIAEPDGTAYIVDSGGPWLATAGSGDVLAGIIAALLASGISPGRAAAAGAWLHCRASDFAGHTCLVASDLLSAIPAAWPRFSGTMTDQHQ
ncbi:MAG: NAD(P)H-hydrate dehydratase [Actinomycetes bacterium]